MKSFLPILVLLIWLVACNSKSHEPVGSAETREKPAQTQVHREAKKEVQAKYRTWDKEPTSVFGIRFGTSKKKVEKIFTLYGCTRSTIMEICKFNHELGDVHLICTVAFSSKSGMQHVRATFPGYERETVLSVLSIAYGQPHLTLPDAENPAKTWGQIGEERMLM